MTLLAFDLKMDGMTKMRKTRMCLAALTAVTASAVTVDFEAGNDGAIRNEMTED